MPPQHLLCLCFVLLLSTLRPLARPLSSPRATSRLSERRRSFVTVARGIEKEFQRLLVLEQQLFEGQNREPLVAEAERVLWDCSQALSQGVLLRNAIGQARSDAHALCEQAHQQRRELRHFMSALTMEVKTWERLVRRRVKSLATVQEYAAGLDGRRRIHQAIVERLKSNPDLVFEARRSRHSQLLEARSSLALARKSSLVYLCHWISTGVGPDVGCPTSCPPASSLPHRSRSS